MDKIFEQYYNELADITLRSLYVSGTATLLAFSWSIFIAYFLALRERIEIVSSIIESMVGMPTVVLGLLLYFLFSHSGPLGVFNLLYTPSAMIIGESVLVTPIIISTTFRVLRTALQTYGEFALSIGATKAQTMYLVFKESYPGIIAAIVMAFSRAIGELGVAFMVGGNIRGYTRVLTTAIALGVSKGEFESSLLLGLILLSIMIITSISLKIISRLYRV
ncbi:MAG: ABC transporter permease [Sulfolobales archaeon]